LNTSQQLGGAIGVAVASTVTAAHMNVLSDQGASATAALSGGLQWALWVCGAIALVAIPVTFMLVRSDELAKAVEATAAPEPSTA
jgi:heme/copper-type cytochrome/quinol oxidase subunit 2